MSNVQNGYKKSSAVIALSENIEFFFSQEVCQIQFLLDLFLWKLENQRERKSLLLGFQHHDQKESNHGCPSKEQKIGTI